jgi:hypothetical protein
VSYVNFDIQGANLLPTLRTTTFAVGAETGGSLLESFVSSAIARGKLDTAMLSAIFGQLRSDYASFLGVQVPSIYFTDATGPCYHTAQDEVDVVDFAKLRRQIRTGLAVARRLASSPARPVFAPGAPLATYADAVAITRVVERALPDLRRFSDSDQQTGLAILAELERIVAAGPAAFGPDDVGTLLGDAATLVVEIVPQGPCEGFLAGPLPVR